MRRPILFITLALIAALIIVFAFATQIVFSTAHRIEWMDAVRVSFYHWRSPFIIAFMAGSLSFLVPIERPHRLVSLLLHIAASVLLVSLAGHLDYKKLPIFQQQRPPLMFREIRVTATFSEDGTKIQQQNLPPIPFRSNIGPPMERGRQFWSVLASSRWQLYLAAFWISCSIVHAWLFYQRAEERERKTIELSAHLSRAKLDTLRLQLQPHFLFNTLNAISTLVYTEPEKADEMITNLSQLLRESLDSTNHEISLSEELETLNIYLEIESTRLGSRLIIHREIAPETLSACVPALLLQPIAENAIRHAIEPRAIPGNLTIRSSLKNDILLISIADDGPGLPPAGRQTDRVGIGIANTQARLRELYGKESSLQLLSPESGGLTVEINIPFHTTPRTNAVV